MKVRGGAERAARAWCSWGARREGTPACRRWGAAVAVGGQRHSTTPGNWGPAVGCASCSPVQAPNGCPFSGSLAGDFHQIHAVLGQQLYAAAVGGQQGGRVQHHQVHERLVACRRCRRWEHWLW